MTREQQNKINELCEIMYSRAQEDLHRHDGNNPIISQKRLRTCSAHILETENFYILVSYRTVVAFIEKCSGDIFDVLRGVFGYTSTSAQHISKFIHDYTDYPYTNNRYTWREI